MIKLFFSLLQLSKILKEIDSSEGALKNLSNITVADLRIMAELRVMAKDHQHVQTLPEIFCLLALSYSKTRQKISVTLSRP